MVAYRISSQLQIWFKKSNSNSTELEKRHADCSIETCLQTGEFKITVFLQQMLCTSRTWEHQLKSKCQIVIQSIATRQNDRTKRRRSTDNERWVKQLLFALCYVITIELYTLPNSPFATQASKRVTRKGILINTQIKQLRHANIQMYNTIKQWLTSFNN